MGERGERHAPRVGQRSSRESAAEKAEDKYGRNVPGQGGTYLKAL